MALTTILLTSLVVIYSVYEISSAPAPPPPHPDFCGAMPEEAINITVTCIKKLNIKELNLEDFTAEANRPIDPTFDDQCLAHCVFLDAKLITDDGFPIVEAFQADFKKYHDKEYHSHLSNATSHCLDFTEKQFEKAGGAKENSCKYSSTLAQCLAAEEFKICHPEGSKN